MQQQRGTKRAAGDPGPTNYRQYRNNKEDAQCGISKSRVRAVNPTQHPPAATTAATAAAAAAAIDLSVVEERDADGRRAKVEKPKVAIDRNESHEPHKADAGDRPAGRLRRERQTTHDGALDDSIEDKITSTACPPSLTQHLFRLSLFLTYTCR